MILFENAIREQGLPVQLCVVINNGPIIYADKPISVKLLLQKCTKHFSI
jgi:hypothetical protein